MDRFRLQDQIKKRPVRISLIVIISIILLYALLKILGIYDEVFLPFFDSIYKTYLLIPEWFANQIFRVSEAPISITNHELIYESESVFHSSYERFITNWPRFLLSKTWSVLILALIWINSYTLKRKLIATLCFGLVHIVAVVAGLYLMGVVYPHIYQDEVSVYLSPTLAGNLIFYVFTAVWVVMSIDVLNSILPRLGINIQPSKRQIREALVLLFFVFVLREFLIPYFHYKPYVNFLLVITEHLGSWFGYPGYIIGDQLRGEFGTLGLSKHCLGFMAFYLFAAFIFLTREHLPTRVTILYIISGWIILSILNIIRLVAIYIIVQGVNGTQRASTHHEIYNVAIYISIFALWIIWYERFVLKAKKDKSTPENSED